MFADQIIAAVVNRFVTVSETFIPSCLLHFCARLVEMFQKCNDCSELHYFSPL